MPTADRFDAPSQAPVKMAELLGSLSLATDMVVGLSSESAMRAAVVAVVLGRDLGVTGDSLRAVYYSALLRFLGCTADAHEGAYFTAGDDLAFLPSFATIDRGRLFPVARHAVTSFVKDADLMVRLRSIGRVLTHPGAYKALGVARCEQAMALSAHFNLGDEVVKTLGQLFDRFDGTGPYGYKGDQLTVAARLLHVAHAAGLHHQFEDRASTLRMLKERSGAELDPEITQIFIRRADELFAVLEVSSAWELFLEAEPLPRLKMGAERLVDVATAFAKYVDMKSPSRLGHSIGVAGLTDAAAGLAGIDPQTRNTLRIAALLHDLGTVSVPNSTWDKPGPLNHVERERVRLHAYHTERILSVAPVLHPAAVIASAHHERLDGSGYHRGTSALSMPARLLASADVLHALGETRAHRPAFSPADTVRIMREEVQAGHLDRDAVAAVLEARGLTQPRLKGNWPAGLSEREVEVLKLVARGLTNKEIGSQLSISARTVQVHVAHIFEKTGVATRAAAALFATQHSLLAA